MKPRHVLTLSILALLAPMAVAQPPRPAGLSAQFADILARDPEARARAEASRARFSDTGEAIAGWEQGGVDTNALLAGLSGGLDEYALAEAGEPSQADAELRTGRPLAEIVPPGWTEVLRFGEVDLHPRHAAILFISSASRRHVVFSRARRWRQGNASCWGPIRGVAVYRPAGAPQDNPALLALETAIEFASAEGQAVCERFDGDLASGFTRTWYLPDGRPLVAINRRAAGARSLVRPLAELLDRR